MGTQMQQWHRKFKQEPSHSNIFWTESIQPMGQRSVLMADTWHGVEELEVAAAAGG